MTFETICGQYCNARCAKKHAKDIMKKEEKCNKKEARKKQIQSDERQARDPRTTWYTDRSVRVDA